jgi:hypothetical protein
MMIITGYPKYEKGLCKFAGHVKKLEKDWFTYRNGWRNGIVFCARASNLWPERYLQMKEHYHL